MRQHHIASGLRRLPDGSTLIPGGALVRRGLSQYQVLGTSPWQRKERGQSAEQPGKAAIAMCECDERVSNRAEPLEVKLTRPSSIKRIQGPASGRVRVNLCPPAHRPKLTASQRRHLATPQMRPWVDSRYLSVEMACGPACLFRPCKARETPPLDPTCDSKDVLGDRCSTFWMPDSSTGGHSKRSRSGF